MRIIAAASVYLSSLSDYVSTMMCLSLNDPNIVEGNPLLALLMDHDLFLIGKMGVTVLMCYLIYRNYNLWTKGYGALAIGITIYYLALTLNNIAIAL